MVRIILLISLIGISFAAKETYDDIDKLLNDENIWQIIEKRVNSERKAQSYNNDDNDRTGEKRVPVHQKFNTSSRIRPFPSRLDVPQIQNKMKTISDSSGNSCSYFQNSSIIIRSKSSIENGAAFLKNAFHLTSKECAEECCYTQNCNLAVYEEKDEHSCYLFDCRKPSLCSYANHGNFSVMLFQNHNYKPSVHQQYHENELDSLGKTPSPPTVVSVTTKRTPTPTPAPLKINGKDCDEDEFQCKNRDCIDSDKQCDDIKQCKDGSDEENCPTKLYSHKKIDGDEEEDEDKFYKHEKDNKDKMGHKQFDDDDEDHYYSPEKEDKDDKSVIEKKPPKPVILDSDKSEEQDQDHLDGKDEKGDKIDDNSYEEEKEPNKINTKVDKQEMVTKTTTTLMTDVSKVAKTPTAQTLELNGPQKVLIKSPTDSNQGPIVALALGLGICLMLLIFVGCRLRTVKSRIRRGKSLHSNEADYLINGMYL